MEDELDCNFVFGNINDGHIKKLDISSFHQKTIQFQTKKILVFNWIKGSVKLAFSSYRKYVLTGDIRCISNWLILIFTRLLGKKTYLWTHGWYGNETTSKIIIKKIFFGLSNGLFLYGDYAKKLMIEEGFSKDKLHVIYNSLSYNLQLEVRKNLRPSNICNEYFQETAPVVIFTGRLTKKKKIDLLIDAHKHLNSQGIKINVLLLGAGQEADYLKEKAEKWGLADFYCFYGECYDENIIGNLYYNSTVCVSPGNVGLTAIHALTYGCPVITHDNFPLQMPEFEAIERGKTGDFFNFADAESLANTIKLWISNNYPKSKHLIENCFEIVNLKFNPDYQIKVFENVLL
jgi:glycosyltransferase involved in cell wall biosynthesis